MEDDELKIPTNVQLFPTEDLLNNFLNKKRKSSNDELSSSCYTERDFGITSNYNIYSKYFLLDNKNTTNHSTHSSVVCDKDSENVEQFSYQSYSADAHNNQKKKLFKTLRDTENEQKQKKLLLNRISAKKSRTKKKNYVLKLEEELKQIKREIAEAKRRTKHTRKRTSANNKQLSKANNSINSNTNSQSNTNSADLMITGNSDQKVSVFHNMIQLLRLTMPISLKVYKEKFLKMEEFDFSCETVDTLIQKNSNNIHILNELYSFEHNTVNKESIAYKLYSYYIKVGNLLNSFKVNYELL